MQKIVYIDRKTKKREIEKVYGRFFLQLFYGNSPFNRLMNFVFLPWLVKCPFFSAFYGYLQKKAYSKKKIVPFIKTFHVDSSEFLEPVSSYQSFNDFFIRKLKPESRPIAPGEDVAIIPADGRYYFYQNIDLTDGFIVKGEKLNLAGLLQSEKLAAEYAGGSIVIARLCPSDYHRFHFPCDCTPGETHFINGWLYSVNPVAIKKDIAIFTKNKRTVCELRTKQFGTILYIEVGATSVGSIIETYSPFKLSLKGSEKGYFEFGGSALILLFQKGRIQFDQDLLAATREGLEIRCLMGQRMGKKIF